MQIKANVSLDFMRYLIPKKITFGNNVVTCLGAEIKVYNNVPIPLDVLLGTNNNLYDAEQAAMSGDKVAIQKRKTLTQLWNDQFRQTANYVSLLADGNIEMIKSTGFLPTKTSRQKKAKITGIAKFTAVVSNEKGVATASCESIKGANGYVSIAAPDGVKISMVGDVITLEVNGTLTRIKTGTQSTATFTGLQSEQRMYMSMFAFNTAGNSPLTDAQSVVPQ